MRGRRQSIGGCVKGCFERYRPLLEESWRRDDAVADAAWLFPMNMAAGEDGEAPVWLFWLLLLLPLLLPLPALPASHATNQPKTSYSQPPRTASPPPRSLLGLFRAVMALPLHPRVLVAAGLHCLDRCMRPEQAHLHRDTLFPRPPSNDGGTRGCSEMVLAIESTTQGKRNYEENKNIIESKLAECRGVARALVRKGPRTSLANTECRLISESIVI